jgi:hypothetical protein
VSEGKKMHRILNAKQEQDLLSARLFSHVTQFFPSMMFLVIFDPLGNAFTIANYPYPD